MPRIPLVASDQIPGEAKEVLDRRAKARGQAHISELFRLLANDPPLAAAFAEQNMRLYDSLPIDAAIREALIIRIANLLHAPYVHAAHADIGRREGLSERQIAALSDHGYRHGELFTPEQIRLIEFAEQVVRAPAEVDDRLCEELIGAYGERGFMAIAMLCAQYTSASVFTTVMKLSFTP